MHPLRRTLILANAKSGSIRADRLGSAREFLVGWTAGLIFFWTMLS